MITAITIHAILIFLTIAIIGNRFQAVKENHDFAKIAQCTNMALLLFDKLLVEVLMKLSAIAARKQQPQQEQLISESSQPALSPRCPVSMPQLPTVDTQEVGHTVSPHQTGLDVGISPADIESAQLDHATTHHLGESESYMPNFSSTPSIFESLFREPGIGARSIAFYEDLTALQHMTVEVRRRFALFIDIDDLEMIHSMCEQMTSNIKQRQTKAQVSSHSALATHLLEIRNVLSRHPGQFTYTWYCLSRSSSDGLLEESILLPFSKTAQPPSVDYAKIKLQVGSPVKQAQERAVAMATEDEVDDSMIAIEPLDNHSEMLHFTT
ncbi:unnamed protein product [Phytophthora lilii]|uniref:Unnamed protein product n=1 Tax=Phytophthora lilii TaxID=2077276 RepID=A0A9W6WWC6_9STRA|nr:unnamed protein product [Phytophthora lilii]